MKVTGDVRTRVKLDLSVKEASRLAAALDTLDWDAQPAKLAAFLNDMHDALGEVLPYGARTCAQDSGFVGKTSI